jgi:hypothetical protein
MNSPSEETARKQQGPWPDKLGGPASTLYLGPVTHPFPLLVLQLSDQKAMGLEDKWRKASLSEDSKDAS